MTALAQHVAAILLAWAALDAAAQPPGALASETHWIAGAAELIEAARSRAPAHEFRAAVGRHRETLRGIVRDAGPDSPHRALHLDMILLNALLLAAADCHSGGRVLCPPELMRRLESQAARLREGLAAAGTGN